MTSALFLPNAQGPEREYSENITLVCQGGGIGGGAYLVGVLGAFEKAGVLEYVDKAYLVSSSSPCFLYTVMGEWEKLKDIWINEITKKEIVNLKRIRQGNILNIDLLLEKYLRVHSIDQDKFKNHRIEMNFSVTNVTDEEEFIPEYLNNHTTECDALTMIEAAISIPILYGGHVMIQDKKYIDGGLMRQLPFEKTNYNEKIVTLATYPMSRYIGDTNLGEQILLAYHEKYHNPSSKLLQIVKNRYNLFRKEWYELLMRSEKYNQPSLIIRPKNKLPAGIISGSSRKVAKTIERGFKDGQKSLSKIEQLIRCR